MNKTFHDVEAPNIVHTNTLAENLADIQEKDILAEMKVLHKESEQIFNSILELN